jgi:hypothetical protein
MDTPPRTCDSPSWICRTLIVMAVRPLPKGVVRDRYRRELTADLTVPKLHQRLPFALRCFARASALRRATRGASTTPGRDVMVTPPKPFLCRAGLHHRWELAYTDDGKEFVRCERCLKERGSGLDDTDRWRPMSPRTTAACTDVSARRPAGPGLSYPCRERYDVVAEHVTLPRPSVAVGAAGGAT